MEKQAEYLQSSLASTWQAGRQKHFIMQNSSNFPGSNITQKATLL